MTAKFWVGGTGTWDSSTTTHWALTTGGAGGAAVPVTGDAVTFDASSGAGTVTASATITGLSLLSLTCGAMGMTLDFSANNPSMTIGTFSSNGSGTRTINMGSGTFTINGGATTMWDFGVVTGLTFNAGTSTIAFATSTTGTRTFATGGKAFATVTISAAASLQNATFTFSGSTGSTFTTLTFTGPVNVQLGAGATITVTNFNATGSSNSNVAQFASNSAAGTAATVSVTTPSVTWAAIGGVTFTGTGSGFTATNSFDLKGNSGVTITGPGGSSIGSMIGA